MCAISGCCVVGPRADPARIAEECHRLLVAGSVRGSDAYGVVAVDRDGRDRAWRGVETPRLDDLRRVVTSETAAVLGASRATPTTELRADQGLSSIQPFSSQRWSVVHNGTIANDRELWRRLGRPATSLVDSAVLPHVFEAHGFAGGLGMVNGSFALAAVDAAEPDVLHLARNFKPLVLARHPELPVVIFASTPEQLQRLRPV